MQENEEKKFEYTNEDYERLKGFHNRSMLICYGTPDQYQFHHNELTKAIADFLLEPYYWKERQKRIAKGLEYEDKMKDSFYPPPWNIIENPEKTEGWLEFQRSLRRGDYDIKEIMNQDED